MTYTATLGIKETSANAVHFIKTNKHVFWNILKPLLPYMLGGYLIDVIATALLFDPNGKFEFFLGSLIASYFYVVLVISWHRVVLHGPARYEPMNPFKPQKHEIAFILMGLGIGIGIAIAATILVGVFAIAGPVGLTLGLLGAVLLVYFLFYKFSFYFPAKAVDASITLKQSFALTKGYLWKMFWSYLRASIKPMLIIFAYVFAAVFTLGVVLSVSGLGSASTGLFGNILGFALMLPVYAYLQPLLTVIAVTVLSNYYQHALQNKPVSAG